MKNQATFIRSGLFCLTLSLLPAGSLKAQAQSATEATQTPSAKTVTATTTANPAATTTTTADATSQAELLKSYLHVREQLHDAELAIANNRLEAEAAARAQAAAIAEKLDSIKSTFAAEREHQATEAQRAAAEQERQRLASQEANHIILWIAVSFGGVGLLTMLATAVLQWRGIKRMTEVTAQHPQLPAVAQQNWLTAGNNGPAGATVALSNQRLMSVIDRMERRILELETSAAQPLPATPVETVVEATTPRATPAALDQAARISALLGKGRSLLNANKAREAVACYDEILAIEANHPEALVKKGSALERLNQDLQAIECYDRAIQADRNLALAYLSKGGVFNRLQRFDEAVECYEKALQVEKQTKPPGVVRVSVSGEWPTSGSSIPA
ncbi:MAG TPA: tetratricopeptide repeat protein [Lacunisphaera sp.]|jgi:tetratricopeptide (TPR) repeat protein